MKGGLSGNTSKLLRLRMYLNDAEMPAFLGFSVSNLQVFSCCELAACGALVSI